MKCSRCGTPLRTNWDKRWKDKDGGIMDQYYCRNKRCRHINNIVTVIGGER